MMWGRIDRRTATEPLLELLARRPELRDVGIAGYLAGEVLGNVSPEPPNWHREMCWERWEVWAA